MNASESDRYATLPKYRVPAAHAAIGRRRVVKVPKSGGLRKGVKPSRHKTSPVQKQLIDVVHVHARPGSASGHGVCLDLCLLCNIHAYVCLAGAACAGWGQAFSLTIS